MMKKKTRKWRKTIGEKKKAQKETNVDANKQR